jgi:bifunctional ADP-heptose synthase (sugar kinase/adenylyltransferase)
MTDKKNLEQTVDKLKGRKVLIVGDVGLDEYVAGRDNCKAKS